MFGVFSEALKRERERERMDMKGKRDGYRIEGYKEKRKTKRKQKEVFIVFSNFENDGIMIFKKAMLTLNVGTRLSFVILSIENVFWE